MTRLILVRHGHVEGISPERFRGQFEIPLSERGQRDAAATAAAIALRWRPAAIYTSPMGRCVETGRAISAAVGIEAETLQALNDLNYGDWHWKTFDEVKAAEPALFYRWFVAPELVRFPHGDSLSDLVARTSDAVRHAADHHPDACVVFVGHDSVNRAILLQALAQPLSAYWRITQSPGGISEIEVEGDLVRVLRMNETAHLDASIN